MVTTLHQTPDNPAAYRHFVDTDVKQLGEDQAKYLMSVSDLAHDPAGSSHLSIPLEALHQVGLHEIHYGHAGIITDGQLVVYKQDEADSLLSQLRTIGRCTWAESKAPRALSTTAAWADRS